MITNNQFTDFLYDVFSNDPVRYIDLQNGFEIIKLELKDKTINATYQFIYREEEGEDWTLFEMTENYGNESFPKGLVLCTVNEDFIWGSNETLNVLDKDDFYYINANPSFDTFLWDDPNLSEDWIDCFFDGYDKYMAGESLVENYGASKSTLPEFIPDRIKSRIKSCIELYLNES